MKKLLTFVLLISLLSACKKDDDVVPEDTTGGLVTSVLPVQWKSDIYPYIRVDHLMTGSGTCKVKMYKRANFDNTGDWKIIDDFELDITHNSHPKKVLLYSGSVWKLKVYEVYTEYTISVNYKTNTVHSKGKVYTKVFSDLLFKQKPIENSWDKSFTAFSTDFVKMTTDLNGHHFIEITDFWSIICSPLPCGPWVIVPPNYSQAFFDTDIDGQEVRVQLWKGLCPQFMDIGNTLQFCANTFNNKSELDKIAKAIPDMFNLNMFPFGEKFPGGVGAEVGLYVKDKVLPDDIWWPYVKPGINIRFVLIDPATRDTLVKAESIETWWRTKWMNTESFNTLGRGSDDVLGYELHFWINDKKYPVWTSDKFKWDEGYE